MGNRQNTENRKKASPHLRRQVDNDLIKKMNSGKSPRYIHEPTRGTIKTKEQTERRRKLYKKSDEEISKLKTIKNSLEKGDLGSK